MADQKTRNAPSGERPHEAPPPRTARTEMLYCFTITTKGEKSYWNRIGTAWVNQDGSINLRLFAVPLDGKIQLRRPTTNERSDA